ncbi:MULTISPECIES: hypothetical protein [Thiomonas]|uniref:Cell wall surface anchor family protein n=1 Tax=Thiomonas arsenitoxydans (strain DSM 22701 / CIP 110005 / 3As) TaxID=426114 RepID=A0A8I1MYF9_THIA3|nr:MULTISPECIES: hypothetical protein [Thiomonas]CQR44766.1 Cell wall surface anchor family protein (modular protein) [Thiomonas sp. CB3]MBN8744613.1 hypothetical protein [Thiomonas arsenitoxydans]ODU96101.1 MAG: hypothetical protein ABT24_09980 [Thiomonas sp. SCN 64-16]CDW92538.1 putative Cell wall surface anchor family protein (modular protein) [Thiomonas sp. CB2]VDY05766.1 Cell wall surface anchor family protein (modular protein) [Thiomonas sp. Bio17B3]
MRAFKPVFLAAALATAATCHAQTFQATAPAPAPDPSAQQSLSAAVNANGNATYDAGMAYYNQQAYQAAANTAQDISNQDASNSGGGGRYGYGDAWQQAADQAQTVANDNQTQADDQIPIQNQNETTQASSLNTAQNGAQPTAQANSTAAQSAAQQGASQSLADIGQQTSVQQGQPTVTNHTGEYLIAGAATQAAMNGLSVTGFTANKTAYQDAQNAASCGNPWCAAGWMAANAVEQNIANGAYAANVAAAPVLGTALNVAAAASALNSAKGTLQQIQSMTGVTQGQTAGSTNTQQALAQTTTQTGVQQGQSATAVSADTSYTSAADAQQNALGAAAQQNQNAAVTAAQAGLAGLSAEYSRNAANQIASYDNAQAQSTGDPTWTQAAGIAQNEVDQQQGIYDYQQNIQNQAIATGNTTAAQENALSPSIGGTLNTAAQNAAANQSSTTLQNIGAQTGVPQGQ